MSEVKKYKNAAKRIDSGKMKSTKWPREFSKKAEKVLTGNIGSIGFGLLMNPDVGKEANNYEAAGGASTLQHTDKKALQGKLRDKKGAKSKPPVKRGPKGQLRGRGRKAVVRK